MTRYYLRPAQNKRNRINESFDDNRIQETIEKHGGLRKSQHDARINASYDIKNSTFKEYIDENLWDEIRSSLDIDLPIREQILECNDGGVIVIGEGYGSGADYRDKIWKRNYKFNYNGKRYLNNDDYHRLPIDFQTRMRREERKN